MKFDQAVLKMAGGGHNLISPAEFEKIPFSERIKLVLEGRVQFLRDGQIIPAREALARDSDD